MYFSPFLPFSLPPCLPSCLPVFLSSCLPSILRREKTDEHTLVHSPVHLPDQHSLLLIRDVSWNGNREAETQEKTPVRVSDLGRQIKPREVTEFTKLLHLSWTLPYIMWEREVPYQTRGRCKSSELCRGHLSTVAWKWNHLSTLTPLGYALVKKRGLLRCPWGWDFSPPLNTLENQS